MDRTRAYEIKGQYYYSTWQEEEEEEEEEEEITYFFLFFPLSVLIRNLRTLLENNDKGDPASRVSKAIGMYLTRVMLDKSVCTGKLIVIFVIICNIE